MTESCIKVSQGCFEIIYCCRSLAKTIFKAANSILECFGSSWSAYNSLFGCLRNNRHNTNKRLCIANSTQYSWHDRFCRSCSSSDKFIICYIWMQLIRVPCSCRKLLKGFLEFTIASCCGICDCCDCCSILINIIKLSFNQI